MNTTTTIRVSRIGFHYYHQRVVGGVAFPEVVISKGRAREIISEWPDTGQETNFDPAPCQWYWFVDVNTALVENTTMAKTRNLMHPLENVPATAVQIGYWYEAGKNTGLKLQFPCGYTALMRYDEIAAAEAAAKKFEVEHG